MAALTHAIQAAGVRLSSAVLAPSARYRKLLILMYHRVLEEPDPLVDGNVQLSTFRWQMAVLKRHFNVLPLGEAVERLVRRSLPPRAACITFDDGYADNFEIALPVLKQCALPATFFVATGFLDGGRMWNDSVIEAIRRFRGDRLDLRSMGFDVYPTDTIEARRNTIHTLLNGMKYRPLAERLRSVTKLMELVGEELPDGLMMRTDQVRSLYMQDMDIGAHTVHHPILARLPLKSAEAEIIEGRAQLQDIIGGAVKSFAYPNGRPGQDYERAHVEIVRRAGFQVSVSTAWGCGRADTDRFQLPRIGSWDPTPLRFAARLLSTYLSEPAHMAG